ncbi:MAG: LysR family transcriptional regulator [Candidatus Limivicinus sp.]
MELKELEYVVVISEEGSISKAAEKLFMAQSSLSQFLKRHETELGVKLFLRTSDGVRPTPSGQIYIQNAKQMLCQYHRLQTRLLDQAAPVECRIDFGISTFRGCYLLPKVLRQFKAEYPAADVILHEHDSSLLQKRIAAGQLDLALVAFRQDQTPKNVKFLMQDEVLLVASRDHPVIGYVREGHGGPDRPWVDLAEISHFEFLLSNRSTLLGSVAKQLFDDIGVVPKCVNSNLSAPFAASLARRGMGLAFTYRSCIEESRDVIYISIGEKRYFINLVLMYPPDGCRSRAIRSLEHFMEDSLQSELM